MSSNRYYYCDDIYFWRFYCADCVLTNITLELTFRIRLGQRSSSVGARRPNLGEKIIVPITMEDQRSLIFRLKRNDWNAETIYSQTSIGAADLQNPIPAGL